MPNVKSSFRLSLARIKERRGAKDAFPRARWSTDCRWRGRWSLRSPTDRFLIVSKYDRPHLTGKELRNPRRKARTAHPRAFVKWRFVPRVLLRDDSRDCLAAGRISLWSYSRGVLQGAFVPFFLLLRETTFEGLYDSTNNCRRPSRGSRGIALSSPLYGDGFEFVSQFSDDTGIIYFRKRVSTLQYTLELRTKLHRFYMRRAWRIRQLYIQILRMQWSLLMQG